MFPLIIVGIVVLFIGLFVLSAMQARRRRQELSAWAASRGLTFNPERDGSLSGRFPAFPCLHQGDGGRYAFNLMQGRWGPRDILAFDYHYETHGTDSKGHRTTHHHRFSAVVLASPVPLKPLFIRRESLFDKMAAFLGYEDIDFESAEFSRRFCVKAPDRRWAFDVMHARTIEFMLSQPDFNLQFDPACVMAWRSTTFRDLEFSQAADLIAGILDRMPAYLVQQQMQTAN